jgi:tRNA A-37 threonylcarbamoyl transferase component Bud32
MAAEQPSKKIVWERRDDERVRVLDEAFWSDPDAFLLERGVVIKDSGYHRAALVLRTEAGPVLVKRFTGTTLGERLQWRLCRTAPQKEWYFLDRLATAGAPVPRPLAFGACRNRGWECWLLTAYIEGAVTYDTVTPPADGPAARAAARALAHAVATVHYAGVSHGDLHAGNMLHVAVENRWLMTDFQQARSGHPSRAALVHDLVQLQHCLGKKVHLRVRLAFLEEYLATFARLTGTEDQQEGFEWRVLFFEIRGKSAAYSIHQAAARSRRTLRRSKDSTPLSEWLPRSEVPTWMVQGWVARGISRQLLTDLLDLLGDPNWHLRADVSLIKNTRSSAAAVYAHAHRSVYIHHQRPATGLHGRLSALWRMQAAERAWRSAWRLRYLHVGAPRPVLAAAGPRGIVTVEDYCGDTVSFEAVVRQGTAVLPRQTERRVVHAVAAAVAFMHSRGVAHSDLRPASMLLTANGEELGVTMTGTDSTRFYTNLPYGQRVRDLAQLYGGLHGLVSDSAVRLFLRAYLRYTQERLDVRQLMLSVRERTLAFGAPRRRGQ